MQLGKENIKKIRLAKKISQASFASIFSLARPSIGAYEEGRSEPKIETIIQIANYFRISIDVLLTRELTVNDIFSFGILNQRLNKAHQLSSLSIGKGRSIALVSLENSVNYIVQHQNAGFLSSLPKITLPNSRANEHRAFELNGSEMEYHQQGLHHGDILIGLAVPLEAVDKVDGEVFVIVTKNEIIIKRGFMRGDNLLLISDNPNYEKILLPVKELLEVWKVIAVYSRYINPPTRLAERILDLEKKMEELTKS